MDHDHSYKLLFSHPVMVADLLRGFIKEDWVQALDFSTLEKISGSYISDDLREREDDIVCRWFCIMAIPTGLRRKISIN